MSDGADQRGRPEARGRQRSSGEDPASGRAARDKDPRAPSVLRIRAFRWFMLSQLGANCALWMHRTTHVWLVLGLADGQGSAVGLVTSLQFAPMILLAFGGSTLGERFDKRRLMMTTQLTVAVGCTVVVVMSQLGAMNLVAAYILAVVLGIPGAVDAPVRLAYPRQLVPRNRLPAAVGMNGAVFQLTRVAGPAVAGAVIGLLGTTTAFACAGGFALAGALSLIRVPRRSRDARIDPLTIPGWPATVRGLRAAGTALPLACGLVLGIGMTNLQLVVPLTLGPAEAGSYGLLLAMIGAGGVVGAALTSALGREPSDRALTLWSALFAVSCLVFAVIHGAWIQAAVLFLAGVLMQTFGTTAISALQLRGAAAVQGRLMTLYVVAFFIWTPIGAPLFGRICDHLGPTVSLIGSAVVCLVLVAGSHGLLGRRRDVLPS